MMKEEKSVSGVVHDFFFGRIGTVSQVLREKEEKKGKRGSRREPTLVAYVSPIVGDHCEEGEGLSQCLQKQVGGKHSRSSPRTKHAVKEKPPKKKSK